AAPPHYHLGQRGVPGAGTQPQPRPPPQRPGAAAGLRGAAEQLPVEQHGGGEHDERRQRSERVMDGGQDQAPDDTDQEPEYGADDVGSGAHADPPRLSTMAPM